jgi:hypothetical protein
MNSKLNGDDFERELDKSPLNPSAITNLMGINLCNVESISWEQLPDGQLLNFSIQFYPDRQALERYFACGVMAGEM